MTRSPRIEISSFEYIKLPVDMFTGSPPNALVNGVPASHAFNIVIIVSAIPDSGLHGMGPCVCPSDTPVKVPPMLSRSSSIFLMYASMSVTAASTLRVHSFTYCAQACDL